jgi:glutathione synthase/RimK-type ligase-like ATP-grasp enzyme
MTKSLLILTPDPETASYEGRWPYVLEAYREALAGIDVEISDQPWSQPLDRTYDLICPLVVWGYHTRIDAFRARMDVLGGAHVNMLNPPDIVGWNADKRYLRDLADAGVRIIPTVFAERLTDEIIAQARADFGQIVVLKPVVSAGAKNTLVFREAHLADAPQEGKSAPPEGAAMIQPFMPAIQTEGEWSLLFFGGAFSHAVLKTPKSGDFRSQPDYDAKLRHLPPPAEALELATAALDYVGRDRLLYARADMVRDTSGRFCLMELELIEPDLYLTYDPEAMMHFKDAVEHAIAHGHAGHH